MLEIGGAFGVAFGIVGLLFASAGVGIGITLLRRMRLRGQALAHGLAAEARCLETYVTHDPSEGSPDQYGRSSSARHVILGFRTQDGRDIRIEDTSGTPRVVGDFVQNRPER